MNNKFVLDRGGCPDCLRLSRHLNKFFNIKLSTATARKGPAVNKLQHSWQAEPAQHRGVTAQYKPRLTQFCSRAVKLSTESAEAAPLALPVTGMTWMSVERPLPGQCCFCQSGFSGCWWLGTGEFYVKASFCHQWDHGQST